MPDYDRGDTARLTLLIRDDESALVDPATLTLTVRTPAGVDTTTTSPAAPIVHDSTGTYHADIAVDEAGIWTYQWETTDPGQVQGGTLNVLAAPLDAAAPPVYYTTAAAVLRDLGQSSGAASAKINAAILDAEEMIDGMLGAWWPDETTGRKIVEGRVMPYQWDKLDRATAKLAARIYRDPQLLTRRDYETIKGPDFERTGGRGAVAVDGSILALLDASGLRRLTGRAVYCRDAYMRPDYKRFLTATRHDGT
jgi:hypothetical protein